MVAVVIQCAARKQGAGFRSGQGLPVRFVARPDLAAPEPGTRLAHPDNVSDRAGAAWREVLADYNAAFVRSGENPFNLRQAWALYAHPVYAALERRFGLSNLYILSAGWGLIRAGYLTPDYDITFSSQAAPISIRTRQQTFRDHRHLADDIEGPVIFIGGAAYLPHFLRLTAGVRAPRRAFFNAAQAPTADQCQVIRYETTRRTNWHYGCAEDLLAGRLDRWLAP